MEISARVLNRGARHEVEVRTAGRTQTLEIAARTSGDGSTVNGGELLLLALATCYCNDLYREAARLGIGIGGCEVTASAVFPGIGLAAESITYAARVESDAPPARIAELLAETDRVAEVHNTLREGCEVRRVDWNTTKSAAG